MLKSPKNVKFKSPHLHLSQKGLKGYKVSQNAVVFKTKEMHLFSPQQREVCRRILSKPVREEYGALNIRFFPHLSMSKKPLQVRMGKGKGKHDKWVAPIKKGGPLLEVLGPVPHKLLQRLYTRVAYRLPVFSKMIKPKRHKNICLEYKTLKQKNYDI